MKEGLIVQMSVNESAKPPCEGQGQGPSSVPDHSQSLTHLQEECAALEAIAAALSGAGPLASKVARARQLVRDRLGLVEKALAVENPRAGQRHSSGCPGAGVGLPGAPVLPLEPKGTREGTKLPQGSPPGLVGKSEAMKLVYRAIARVSHSQASLLLRGESGTGKELVAKAIHQTGPKARGPFVRLHCAAMTESLLESELFGHERGAFTGALEARKGRFELAHGGTLFLDEIGDIPLTTQVKLLRVLQDKCFERVGGNRPLTVDVRVVSATHRDLEAMVRAGTFREDLYYRLNVVPIVLPPLRERDGDISLLIDHYLARFNRENHRSTRLGPDLHALMLRYHWPGNVRELQNCVERLVVMADSETVTLATVPMSLRAYFADMRQVTGGPGRRGGSQNFDSQPLGQSLQDIERQQLVLALEQQGWVQARVARALGLTPRQVAYKIRKYGIQERPASGL